MVRVGAAAVVGKEKEHGVIRHAQFLQASQQPPDILVDAVHHGRVSLHQARLFGPFLLAEAGPVPGPLSFVPGLRLHQPPSDGE